MQNFGKNEWPINPKNKALAKHAKYQSRTDTYNKNYLFNARPEHRVP